MCYSCDEANLYGSAIIASLTIQSFPLLESDQPTLLFVYVRTCPSDAVLASTVQCYSTIFYQNRTTIHRRIVRHVYCHGLNHVCISVAVSVVSVSSPQAHTWEAKLNTRIRPSVQPEGCVTSPPSMVEPLDRFTPPAST